MLRKKRQSELFYCIQTVTQSSKALGKTHFCSICSFGIKHYLSVLVDKAGK